MPTGTKRKPNDKARPAAASLSLARNGRGDTSMSDSTRGSVLVWALGFLGGLVSLGIIAVISFLYHQQTRTHESLNVHLQAPAHSVAAEAIDTVTNDVTALGGKVERIEDDVTEIKGDVKVLLERSGGPISGRD